MQLQALVLAALALEGALAQPAHRHAAHHQHKRSLREVLTKRWGTPAGGWDNPALYSGVNWAEAYAAGQGKGQGTGSPAETPAPSSGGPVVQEKDAATPGASSSSGSGSGSGSGKSSGTGSCANLASSKLKRATVEEDTYVGNTGGQDPGSNLIAQSTCGTPGTYSVTFTNNMGSDSTFWFWNKIGAGGAMNGMMTDPSHTFDLAHGQSGTFEVQSNSQVGFSQACGRATGNGNVPNCNVGEANFNDQNSHGGSFYDVSMVTYNDIKNGGGSPVLVPMTISAPGYSDSTDTQCVYTDASQNSPVQPGPGGCAMGPIDSSPFHITVTYG